MNYREKLEKHLGRKLKSTEIVHHIDGNCENNSIDNLHIVTQKQHRAIHKTNPIDWEQKLLQKLIKEKNNDCVKAVQSLKLFFSPRQLDIIFKKFKNDILSKTEKEYYSRTIKKKLKALANPILTQTINNFIYINL